MVTKVTYLLCRFAMTYQKSQGKTLRKIILDTSHVSLAQLYVGISRVRKRSDLAMLQVHDPTERQRLLKLTFSNHIVEWYMRENPEEARQYIAKTKAAAAAKIREELIAKKKQQEHRQKWIQTQKQVRQQQRQKQSQQQQKNSQPPPKQRLPTPLHVTAPTSHDSPLPSTASTTLSTPTTSTTMTTSPTLPVAIMSNQRTVSLSSSSGQGARATSDYGSRKRRRNSALCINDDADDEQDDPTKCNDEDDTSKCEDEILQLYSL